MVGAPEALRRASGVAAVRRSRRPSARDKLGHRLARWLEQHPGVEIVRYPGLTSHPGHPIAAAQLGGFGSMISFDVAGGAAAADTVCGAVKLIRHASSLGAVESTMERRAANAGQEHLPPSLLRLSVGIESFDDLRSDLEQALHAVQVR